MAEDHHVTERPSLAVILRVAGVAGGLVYLTANAATQGFVRSFGLARADIAGIEKTTLFDPSIVFAAVLGGLLSPIPLMFIGASFGLRRWWRWLDAHPSRLKGWARVLALFAGFVALGATLWVAIRLQGLRRFLSTVAGLGMGAAVISPTAVRLAGRAARLAWPLAGALVVTSTVCAYVLGASWGNDVRYQRRTREPFLAVVLVGRWPQGAIVEPSGAPASDGSCAEEILLGDRGGSYVLYNTKVDRVHEVPKGQHLTRTPLGAVRRSGGCGRAVPASAR